MEEIKGMEVKGGVLTVTLSGEIDFGKADAFYNTVLAEYKKQPTSVNFDCAELQFIDSTTLGTFVKFLKTVKGDGFTMKLVNLQPKIKKLFVICALDRIMEIA